MWSNLIIVSFMVAMPIFAICYAAYVKHQAEKKLK